MLEPRGLGFALLPFLNDLGLVSLSSTKFLESGRGCQTQINNNNNNNN